MKNLIIVIAALALAAAAYFVFFATAQEKHDAKVAVGEAQRTAQREAKALAREAVEATEKAQEAAKELAEDATLKALEAKQKREAEEKAQREAAMKKAAEAAKAEAKTPAATNEETKTASNAIVLFNGKNLEGFYTYLQGTGKNQDPDKVFSVTPEGWLRISGQHHGYLCTERVYSNYRLVAEFKWGKATWDGKKLARDSGLFFHANGPDKLWPKSLEVQLKEGATCDICLIGKDVTLTVDGKKHRGGCIDRPGKQPWKNELGFRGPNEIEKPLGEWNTLELVCHGNNVRVSLNGSIVQSGEQADPFAGKIYLQSLNAELFYRKLELYSLPLEK